MASFFGSSDVKSKVTPWSGVRDELGGLNTGTAAYLQRANKNPYTGDFYAGLTPDQTAAGDMTRNFVNGVGGQIGGALNSAALQAAGFGANYGANANQLYDMASQPATSGILSRIGAYANNPTLDASLGALGTDINQQLQESLAPMRAGFAAQGNTNNGRAGLREGVAIRGANDAYARESAAMRADAYNQATNLATQDYFGGLNGALAANAQVGNSAEVGTNLANSAANYNANQAGQLQNVGAMYQADNQGQLSNDYQKWQAKYQQPLSNLQQAAGIYGASTGFGTTTQSGAQPGLGTQLLGAGLTLAPAVIGASFGGPAGLMAGLGASGAGLPTSWGGASPATGSLSSGMSAQYMPRSFNSMTGMFGGI